jgi:hypothetical protein
MKTQTNKQTQTLDPSSQSYVDEMRRKTQEQYGKLQDFANPYGGSFSPEISQYLTQGAGGFGSALDASKLGFSALSGDRNALDRLVNPMLAELDPAFAKSAQFALKQANEAGTQSGAFGSRRDVLRGSLLSNVANARAGARVQALNDAYGRAGQLANLGMGASQGLAGIGQYLTDSDRQQLMAKYADYLRQQGIPEQLIGLLGQGLGPTGTTNTTQTQSSPLTQLLGVGLSLIPGGSAVNQAAGVSPGGSVQQYYPDGTLRP